MLLPGLPSLSRLLGGRPPPPASQQSDLGCAIWGTWPEGGDHLSSSALQAVEHSVGQLETSLDGKKLLDEGLRGVGCNFCTSQPSLITAGLDHLGSGYRMAREEVCPGRRRKRPRL